LASNIARLDAVLGFSAIYN